MKRNITIYDNKGKTLDRYTIVFNTLKISKKWNRYEYECISSSETGSGVFLWTTCQKSRNLGTKVKFSELNTELQNRIDRVIKSMP